MDIMGNKNIKDIKDNMSNRDIKGIKDIRDIKGIQGLKTDQYYEKEIGAIKQELKKSPDAHLTMKKRGPYYYETNGKTQKGITKDPQKIRPLARKAYLLQRLKHLEWNFSIAKKLSGRLKTEDPIEIIRGLAPAYQSLPVSYFFHPCVHERMEVNFLSYSGHNDGLIYLTDSGIYVRSKSERTIANALDQKGIPYRYEAALGIGGSIRYPDFMIERPFDGRTILWEHFGLMDNDEYRQNVVEKLTLYIQYDFFPCDNLICTYEEDLRDPSRIYALIELFLMR